MNSDVVAPEILPPMPLNRMTTEELRAELGRAISMTADSLAYLSACWVELERRGEDLSGLRVTLAPYLREVAAGTLAPEAVISFAGKKMVLKWVSRQSIETQRKLASNPLVTLVEPSGRKRPAMLGDLTGAELRLVEGAKHDPAGDRAAAVKRKAKPRRTVGFSLSNEEFLKLTGEAFSVGRTVSDHIRSLLGFSTIGKE